MGEKARRHLPEVHGYHADTVDTFHTRKPTGDAMAGEDEHDPFRD